MLFSNNAGRALLVLGVMPETPHYPQATSFLFGESVAGTTGRSGIQLT